MFHATVASTFGCSILSLLIITLFVKAASDLEKHSDSPLVVSSKVGSYLLYRILHLEEKCRIRFLLQGSS